MFKGREIEHTERCPITGMADGTSFAVRWLHARPEAKELTDVELAGVRADVHESAILFDETVRQQIKKLKELAPLDIRTLWRFLGPLKNELRKTQLAVAFDTAFHRTLPEVAWRYPIKRATADRNKIRKYGFRGISQRYMTEEYARITSKHVDDVTVVTLHLESGSSAAALKNGKSIDIDGADAA